MNEVLAALFAVAGGLAGGLLGVGGGILFVPAMTIFLDLGQVRAESTSLLIIVIVAMVGAYRQRGYGNVRLREAALIGILSPLGVLAGVVLANAVPERALKLAFAALALFFAVQLARRALGSATSGGEIAVSDLLRIDRRLAIPLSEVELRASRSSGPGVSTPTSPLRGSRRSSMSRPRPASPPPSGPGSHSATGGGSWRSPRTPAARPATASWRWNDCGPSCARRWPLRSRGARPGRRVRPGSGDGSRSAEIRPASVSAAAPTRASTENAAVPPASSRLKPWNRWSGKKGICRSFVRRSSSAPSAVGMTLLPPRRPRWRRSWARSTPRSSPSSTPRSSSTSRPTGRRSP